MRRRWLRSDPTPGAVQTSISTIQRWTKGPNAEIDAASPAVDSSLSPGCRLRWSSASATTAAVVKLLMTSVESEIVILFGLARRTARKSRKYHTISQHSFSMHSLPPGKSDALRAMSGSSMKAAYVSFKSPVLATCAVMVP